MIRQADSEQALISAPPHEATKHVDTKIIRCVRRKIKISSFFFIKIDDGKWRREIIQLIISSS